MVYEPIALRPRHDCDDRFASPSRCEQSPAFDAHDSWPALATKRVANRASTFATSDRVTNGTVCARIGSHPTPIARKTPPIASPTCPRLPLGMFVPRDHHAARSSRKAAELQRGYERVTLDQRPARNQGLRAQRKPNWRAVGVRLAKSVRVPSIESRSDCPERLWACARPPSPS